MKDEIECLIAQAQSWINRSRWHKVQYGVLSCIKCEYYLRYI